MISLFSTLVTIALLYVSSRLWLLSQNYRVARATGLPIVVCPYDPDGVRYWLLIRSFTPSQCAQRGPFLRVENTGN
jgi:hypothetical protein